MAREIECVGPILSGGTYYEGRHDGLKQLKVVTMYWDRAGSTQLLEKRMKTTLFFP